MGTELNQNQPNGLPSELKFYPSPFTLFTLLKELVAAKLSADDIQLLQEYDDIYFQQIIRRDELLYTAALMDGILLGYWVALVGRGVGKITV